MRVHGRLVVQVGRAPADGGVVVALDDHCTLGRIAHHHLDHRLRVCAVAHQIAEEGVPGCAAGAGVFEAGVERLEVRVKVGEEREDQG